MKSGYNMRVAGHMRALALRRCSPASAGRTDGGGRAFGHLTAEGCSAARRLPRFTVMLQYLAGGFALLSIMILIGAVSALSAQPFSQDMQPGAPMVITAGNDVGWQVTDPGQAREAFLQRGELRCDPQRFVAHWDAHGGLYAEHGVTAFEPYVKWMLMEPKEGVWDPSFYDAELAAFKKHGLRWTPFLIAGPAYATPPWFKESDESVFALELATGDVSRDQSIWNPSLRPRVRSWLKRFFDHYDHADMQAVLLGISGVFGESIYTAGGNVWTQIWDGKYPQHFGWWCGDEFAVADFRRAMRAKYTDIKALNAAWKTDQNGWEDVAPFVPDGGHTMRARLDMVRWYMQSMTDFAEWWVATTRELCPDRPILLCTGGGGSAELGADMTAQTKMVARHGAGMRITNEASDYSMNFLLTRVIGSAARQYGTYFGYEPAGAVDNNGIVARIYNSVASGAWELFHYDNPPQGDRGARYKQYLDIMRVREPAIEVGVLWPRTSVDVHAAAGLGEAIRAVRDICDVELIDERMIADGALENLRVLVWAAGTVTEPETAQAIRQAVERGMTLIVPAAWAPLSPEGEAVFPAGRVPAATRLGDFSIPSLPSGKSTDGPWREGRFFGAEPDSMWNTGRRMCWTSGDVSVHIPLPAQACEVRLPYRVGSLPEPARFIVDGQELKSAPGDTIGELVVPSEGNGDVLTITIQAGTWQPSEAGQSTDQRKLSVVLRDIIVRAREEVGVAPASSVAAVIAVGKGHVVASHNAGAESVESVLGEIITRPDRHGVPGVSAEAAIDGQTDLLYVTVTTEDILLYNHGDEARTAQTPQGAVEVPAHSIVSAPR